MVVVDRNRVERLCAIGFISRLGADFQQFLIYNKVGMCKRISPKQAPFPTLSARAVNGRAVRSSPKAYSGPAASVFPLRTAAAKSAISGPNEAVYPGLKTPFSHLGARIPQPEFGTGQACADGYFPLGACNAPPWLWGKDGIDHHGIKLRALSGLEAEKCAC